MTRAVTGLPWRVRRLDVDPTRGGGPSAPRAVRTSPAVGGLQAAIRGDTRSGPRRSSVVSTVTSGGLSVAREVLGRTFTPTSGDDPASELSVIVGVKCKMLPLVFSSAWRRHAGGDSEAGLGVSSKAACEHSWLDDELHWSSDIKRVVAGGDDCGARSFPGLSWHARLNASLKWFCSENTRCCRDGSRCLINSGVGRVQNLALGPKSPLSMATASTPWASGTQSTDLLWATG
mmetsp:Transcript_32074/g.83145  ORF Transcript_32074/g.83145 Transcript_32074/m.83145 type:complete len:232 (+) Transcript_32074:534-1229(+)